MKRIIITTIMAFLLIFAGCSAPDSNVAVTPKEQITKNFLEEENEKGNIYELSYHRDNIVDNMTILINTNGKKIRLLKYEISSSLNPSSIYLYENSSFDTADEIYSKQKYRENITNSSAITYTNPTNLVLGEELEKDVIFGEKRIGGDTEGYTPYDWILRPNTTYAIYITDFNNNEPNINLNLVFREVDKE